MAEEDTVEVLPSDPSASNFLDSFFGRDASDQPDIYSLLVLLLPIPLSSLHRSFLLLLSLSPLCLRLLASFVFCLSLCFQSDTFHALTFLQAPRTAEELAEYNSDDGDGEPEISSDGQASLLSFHVDE
eukprot:759722-Hanusia_phi.AAC.2